MSDTESCAARAIRLIQEEARAPFIGQIVQLRTEIERLEADNKRMRAALTQIETVCKDNFPDARDKRMALDFIHQIVTRASSHQETYGEVLRKNPGSSGDFS